MSVVAAINERVSTRSFKSTPLNQELLNEIFTQAQKSPSNCNVQPWQTFVVSGDKKNELSQALTLEVMKGQPPQPDFNWSVKYEGIHRDRQFGSANALYSALGIKREDKMGRNMAMLKNWSFFGAPHVAFFTLDKKLDIMGAVDIGIYAQSLALLMKEKGISCCMQGALGQFPAPIHELCNLGEDQGVLFGMSFGYSNDDDVVNTTRTDRAALKEAVAFID